MKKLRENKVFRITMKVINALVVIALLGFILVVCLQRFSGNKIAIFKYRMFIVISESMKPKYEIGDVLIAKEVEPATIKVGDTISYLGERGSFKDKVITHQVTKIDLNREGKYVFHAQGLANLVEDPLVGEHQLYGVVVYKSLLLSLIYRIISTSLGFYLFIVIPLMYIIGSEMLSFLLAKEAKRQTNE